MTNAKKELKLSQRDRILRVFLLSKFYCDFRDIYLNECLLRQNNDYESAESISGLMNQLFKQDTKPTDFISDKEKVTNDLIDKSIVFNKNLKELNESYVGIDDKLVLAFCKNIEHGSFHILKVNNCFVYQTNWLLSYWLQDVGKDSFLEGFKEIDIFSKKKKYNNIKYKKTFLAIEKTYYEIGIKQILRKINQ